MGNVWILKKRLRCAREMLKKELKRNKDKRNKKKINSLCEGMQNLRMKIKKIKDGRKNT
jgi:hypothetical protein